MSEATTSLIYSKQQPLLKVRSAAIRVVEGNDKGALCPISLKRILVGTAQDNDLVLHDSGVSRHHLQIQIHERGYWIQDLDSTNGTYYRGARISDVFLGAASELRLGETILRLEVGEPKSIAVEEQGSFHGLIGQSQEMQKLFGLLATVAPADVTLLLQGETGTGKEVVAEAVHQHSPRFKATFNILDCGAIPTNLIESELFGHKKGAFTGATEDRPGIFERSHRGTVFLDEIGELPLTQQTRLLRVLDRRTIKRIGDDTSKQIDVRLIAATNKDLFGEVKKGTFREDLYYRLAAFKMTLPPLRKRKQDIPLLARHFLKQAGALDPEQVLTPQLLKALSNRRWSGNVRQLRNVMERALLMVDSVDEVGEEKSELSFHGVQKSIPSDPSEPPKNNTPASAGWLSRSLPEDYLKKPYKMARELLLQQFDQLYIGKLVEQFGNNISAIARAAGLDRHVTRRLLRKYGLYK